MALDSETIRECARWLRGNGYEGSSGALEEFHRQALDQERLAHQHATRMAEREVAEKPAHRPFKVPAPITHEVSTSYLYRLAMAFERWVNEEFT